MVALLGVYALVVLVLFSLCAWRDQAHFRSQCRKLQREDDFTVFGECFSSSGIYTNLFLFPRRIYSRDFWDKYFEDKGILLFPRLSVSRLLTLAGRLTGLSGSSNRKEAILKLLRLERVKDREMRFLSQGDQKKAVLGMELMAPVSDLLLEEPLHYLDHFSSKSLQAFLYFLDQEYQSSVRVSVGGPLPLLVEHIHSHSLEPTESRRVEM